MKKKILVPIMALAMVVAAGVNYKMISECSSAKNMSLASFIKISVSQAETYFNDSGDWCVDEMDGDGCTSSGYNDSYYYDDGSSYSSYYTDCSGSTGTCTDVSYSCGYDSDGNYVEYEVYFSEENC